MRGTLIPSCISIVLSIILNSLPKGSQLARSQWGGQEEVVEVDGHAGRGAAAASAAVDFGAHGVEVDQPGIEEVTGHLIQG